MRQSSELKRTPPSYHAVYHVPNLRRTSFHSPTPEDAAKFGFEFNPASHGTDGEVHATFSSIGIVFVIWVQVPFTPVILSHRLQVRTSSNRYEIVLAIYAHT